MSIAQRLGNVERGTRRRKAMRSLPAKTYRPHGAAASLMQSDETEVLIEGPAGTGKTRAVLEKLYQAVHQTPGSRALIVRKTRQSLSETVLVTWEEKVIPAGHPVLAGASRRLRQTYVFPGGGTVNIGGMEGGSKGDDARIMSSEYDLICCFESTDLTMDDWEKLLTRLRNNVLPVQQIVADCNPGAPSHWLNKRANEGAMARLLSRHNENPMLFDQETGDPTEAGTAYLATLSRLSGVRRARLLDGKWAAADGMVYDGFDPVVHALDTPPKMDGWKRIRSIDFGYTNPFVCQWWAIDGDGRMYLYRELYGRGRIVSDWAEQIKRLSAGETYEATVADHDAEDRATLRAAGIDTRPAHKAVKPGIDAVQERLRDAGDGRPRLYLVRDALVERDGDLADEGCPVSTLEEIEGYVWPKGSDGRATKEHPVKDNDHGMDAMRYAVAYVDRIGRTVPVATVVRMPKMRQDRIR